MLGLMVMNYACGGTKKQRRMAEKKPVMNVYHGIKVEDNYQWLENDNNPGVKGWSDAENKQTRAYLDG